MNTKKSFIFKMRFLTEKIFPRRLFLLVRKIYKSSILLLEFVLRVLNYILLFLPNIYLKNKKIYLFCFKELGIGDRLVITSLLKHYKKRGKVILINSTNDVYKNLGIELILLKKNLFDKLIITFFTNSYHSNIIGVFGNFLNYSKKEKDNSDLLERLFYKRKDISEEIKTFPHKPIIKFTEEEVQKFMKRHQKLFSHGYGIIMSGSYLNGLPTIKDIGREKMQKVVDNVGIKWIQTGMKDEPLLKGVRDFREISLREVFFIVSKSKIVVTIEGMLTHLAGAFNIPCISIYTGFHDPKISKYQNTFSIQPNPLPPCAYCWDHVCKKTGSAKALCAKEIHIKDIVNLTKKVLK